VVDIVVCDAFVQGLDLVFKLLAAKGWLVRDVERKVDGYDLAGTDFFGCGGYTGWR
jgi:hypothetical protein